MKVVRIIYPCIRCGRLINPEERFCPYCRREQENIKFRRHFNLFYCIDEDEGRLSVVFKGHILNRRDMEKQLRDVEFTPGRRYFMGTYRLSETKKIPDSSDEVYTFLSFQPVVDGRLGDDLGISSRQVTTFEI